MRRLPASAVISALMLLWTASSAAAQEFGREWFERMSGPGSFYGFGLRWPIGCFWNVDDQTEFVFYWETPGGMQKQERKDSVERIRPGTLYKAASDRLWCFEFGFTTATNRDREQAGLISIRQYEGVATLPLERFRDELAFLEPSLAVGAVRFLDRDVEKWRFTLSPRIIIKPLKLIPASSAGLANDDQQARSENKALKHKKGDWRGFLVFSYGAIFITPSINNDDLKVSSDKSFSHGWLQRGTWIGFDLSEWVGLR